jgi:signal peptidase I
LPRKSRRWVKFLAVLLAGVLLNLFLARPYVAEFFKVADGGMLPTFAVGERVLIDKVTYHVREPERGDIVVYRSPEGKDEAWIHRVVSLPGDSVEVRDGVLFVNGERQEEPYLNTRFPDSGFYGPTTVPPKHLFMMGDHRTDSRDSRFFGPVPVENIEGSVF